MVSPESGKVIHEIYASTPEACRITLLAWAVNLTDKATTKARGVAARCDLDEILGQTIQEHARDAHPDLPRTLALLDIEGTIPKLSPLPSGKE